MIDRAISYGAYGRILSLTLDRDRKENLIDCWNTEVVMGINQQARWKRNRIRSLVARNSQPKPGYEVLSCVSSRYTARTSRQGSGREEAPLVVGNKSSQQCQKSQHEAEDASSSNPSTKVGRLTS